MTLQKRAEILARVGFFPVPPAPNEEKRVHPSLTEQRRRTMGCRAFAILSLLFLSGCAAANQRLMAFPTRGQDQGQLSYDAVECEQIAKGKKQDPTTAALIGGAGGAAIGGAGGAATGAIVGAMFSGVGRNAGYGAAIGGLVGLASGIATAVQENERRYLAIYAACMASRGYTVGG
jgi:hypothetical protein